MRDETAAGSTNAIDKVRASKAGHAYHEAWAARTALELLPPSTDLTAITLEGFGEQDEQELGVAKQGAASTRATAPIKVFQNFMCVPRPSLSAFGNPMCST